MIFLSKLLPFIAGSVVLGIIVLPGIAEAQETPVGCTCEALSALVYDVPPDECAALTWLQAIPTFDGVCAAPGCTEDPHGCEFLIVSYGLSEEGSACDWEVAMWYGQRDILGIPIEYTIDSESTDNYFFSMYVYPPCGKLWAASLFCNDSRAVAVALLCANCPNAPIDPDEDDDSGDDDEETGGNG